MKKQLLMFVMAALLFAAGMMQAKLITIAIEAEVDWVDDDGNYLEGKINPGDIITGSYAYDSDTLDSSASASNGIYWHYDTPCGFSLTAGGFEFKTDPSNVEFLFGIANDWYDDDRYRITSYNNLPLSNGIAVDDIWWELEDSSGQAISSTALPLTAPVLSDWTQPSGLRIEYSRFFNISAHVTSAVLVPEPFSAILLGLGICFIRRKHSNG